MSDKYYKRAKICIMIPIIIFFIAAATFPLNQFFPVGDYFTVWELLFGAIVYICPIPCMILSVIGVKFAGKAEQEGLSAKWLKMIGMFEIPAIVLFLLMTFMVY